MAVCRIGLTVLMGNHYHRSRRCPAISWLEWRAFKERSRRDSIHGMRPVGVCSRDAAKPRTWIGESGLVSDPQQLDSSFELTSSRSNFSGSNLPIQPLAFNQCGERHRILVANWWTAILDRLGAGIRNFPEFESVHVGIVPAHHPVHDVVQISQ